MFIKLKGDHLDFVYKVQSMYANGVTFFTALIPIDLAKGQLKSFTHYGKIIEKAIDTAQRRKGDRIVEMTINHE